MSEENEVPSDEEILKHITCEAVVLCNYKHPCVPVSGSRALSTMRTWSTMASNWSRFSNPKLMAALRIEFSRIF